jgi:hypothetical protein
MAMERYEVHGVKVYQLNICEAIGDHHLCPGITTLKAGDYDLGTVACNCPCHLKVETKPSCSRQNGPFLVSFLSSSSEMVCGGSTRSEAGAAAFALKVGPIACSTSVNLSLNIGLRARYTSTSMAAFCSSVSSFHAGMVALACFNPRRLRVIALAIHRDAGRLRFRNFHPHIDILISALATAPSAFLFQKGSSVAAYHLRG